ncbi:m7GpppX diphosphatase [Atheta coriaria]|uniref:m7GpppX diphosphatase n=1 Tax=Dalotia coriaria TaxID=877792 RepID=UPI0031F3CC4D
MAESNGEEVVVPLKKPHLEVSLEEKKESVHNDLQDLSKFKIERVLSSNAGRKSITLKGTFGHSPDIGIVVLEKTAFEEKKLREEDYLGTCRLKQDFHNDIYGNYQCFPKAELNTVKTTVIHPATEKHIERYGMQVIHIINETPAIYKDIIEPGLQDSTQFTLQWVYNILEHKSEESRIVYEDSDPTTGFILLPDLKWDGKTVETLYLLALPHLRNIKSLRDLTGEHLPLLKHIYNTGTKVISDKFGIPASRLRVYLHYQPSFYHLHVHFATLQYDAPGVFAEKCHLLANVISNIELVSDYYQRVTLPFAVRENDSLFKKLEDKGHLKKIVQVDKDDCKTGSD